MTAEERRRALTGASRSLAAFLEQDERAPEVLASSAPLPASYRALLQSTWDGGGLGAVRLEKRRRLMEIAARDLNGELSLEEVGRALSDLADGFIEVVLSSLEPPPGFAVISMGKLGGRELNYSSDIDLMFVGEGDTEEGLSTAAALVAALGDFSPEGQAFRVDLNLRPEGRNGALVRSLDGYLEYYRKWAHDWEFQALIKARPSAGDADVGARFMDATRPLVFVEEISESRVHAIRRMKERVETHAAQTARKSKADDRDDVKLGPGGIRDIEFSVQLLQLVHGGTDGSVRDGSTLGALESLVRGGYVAEEDGAGLEVAYRWLRNVEHRLQLWQERQTHRLPSDGDGLKRVAHALGFKDSPAVAAEARFADAHRGVLADVRGRFEKLFYRPMIQALADPASARLSRDALKDRLRVLGFRDAERASRTLEGLVVGTSRRAKLLRLLTPPLLRFLASTPQPDEGLFSFLRLGEALHGRIDSLNALRDNPPGLALLARVLGSGRILGEVLAHVPEEIFTIADASGPGEPKTRDQLVHEAVASLEWRGPDRLLEGLRRVKRREMLRVAIGDVAGTIATEEVGRSLSHLADACLEAALAGRGAPFAVIGMGKLGGSELGYSSDIDVMFVFEGDPKVGESIAEDLFKAIGEVTPEGQAFRIDAGLRPEGKAGPLARSMDSYLEYYGRWSKTWEHQALLKARFVAGDEALGRNFIEATRDLAFPEDLPRDALSEIRHLKVRMERERIPRGTDPRRHLKLGPGGMTDVEFAAQVLQLRYGRDVPAMRTTGTIAALQGAGEAQLLSPSEVTHLVEAYRFLLRLRNRLFFLYGRPVDALPVKPEGLEALGVAMGFEGQPRQELEEIYLRTTRRARRVSEDVIFDRKK